MKNLLAVLLCIIIATSLCVAACTPQASPSKPIELKVVCFEMVGTGPFGDSMTDWAKELETRSQGRVKATMYYGESLGKVADQWEMVKTGLCDVANVNTGSYPEDQFPLTYSLYLPFLYPVEPTPSQINTIFDKYLKSEWEGVKHLWIGSVTVVPDCELHTIDKEIRVPEDLKGMQIRGHAGQSDLADALGCTLVMIPPPEVYTALERGMAEGCFFPSLAMKAFKLEEICKFHTRISFSLGGNNIVMNQQTWDKLPGDIKDIVEDLSPWAQQLHWDLAKQYTENALSIYEGPGQTVVEITPEETAKWVEACKPVVSIWESKVNDMGLPGTELVKDVRNLK